MRRLLWLMCLWALPLSAVAEPELRGSPDELRAFLEPKEQIVRLDGSAEKKGYTDRAIVSLLVTTEEKLLSGAIEANRDMQERVAAAFVAAGIPAEAIQRARFSSSPQQGWFGRESYTVVNRLAVRITETGHLLDIAKVADAHEEVELSELTFEHTGEDAFRAQVRAEALDDIMEQKAFYERHFGVTLTPVNWSDGDIVETRRSLSRIIQMRQVSSEGSPSAFMMEDRSSEPAGAPTSFDEILYHARLQVIFRIEAPKRAPR